MCIILYAIYFCTVVCWLNIMSIPDVLITTDERKTNRNIYFVSIHNSLYTQCIGAPIKKHFFPNLFFQHFLKSHRFFFFYRKQRSSVHEQATTEFLMMSCKVNNSAAQVRIISEAKTRHKKNKTSCLLLT